MPKTKFNTYVSYKGPMLCIDPGINTGYACFPQDDAVPFCTNVIKPSHPNWDIAKIVHFTILRDVFSRNDHKIYKKVYIERPKYFSSHIGQTAADTDALFKLCFIYGGTYAILSSLGYEIVEIPVISWKGQMTKLMVDRRIARAINKEYPNHVSDAVGIGLYVRGLLT